MPLQFCAPPARRSVLAPLLDVGCVTALALCLAACGDEEVPTDQCAGRNMTTCYEVANCTYDYDNGVCIDD